jgi:nucleoside-diphosphate-sugar epimerase
MPDLPATIRDEAQLDDLLSAPTPELVAIMGRLRGDILILGVGGKMGPTLARMARRAADAAEGGGQGPKSKVQSPKSAGGDNSGGGGRRVIGIARFSNPAVRTALEAHGVETITCDLLDPAQLERLPEAPLIVYMASMKFGATGNEPLTWAMNTHMPTLICRRYPQARMAVFSTGNVYGLCPRPRGGSAESDPLNPVGEYAMSCLGRERMFSYFSATQGTRVALIRLNYACELRYGVLVDLAQKVLSGREIDLAMGYFNVIWQGDANAMALRALEAAGSPAVPVNVAGPEILSVRTVCEEFARLFDKPARFVGVESPDALLSNAQAAYRLLGAPTVGVRPMILWIADWLKRGGATLGKPTHFEARSGKF